MSEFIRDKILFINHKKSQCGVWEYGFDVFSAIKKSDRYDFIYAECSDFNELKKVVCDNSPSAIIYNYFGVTMGWLGDGLGKREDIKQIYIMHEFSQKDINLATNNNIDAYISQDPTIVEKKGVVYKTPRLIPNYVNKKEVPSKITIGSFGFPFDCKGFDSIVDVVQKQFDNAKIRIHMPSATYGDTSGKSESQITQKCKNIIKKKGIEIEFNYSYLSKVELLDFLAENTINLFLYKGRNPDGISSATDYALAVQRPMAITKSPIFRHLLSATPSICVEDLKLKTIIDNGVAPLFDFYEKWSESNFILRYEKILDNIFGRNIKMAFNKILDDMSRNEHSETINMMFKELPDVMSRKIERANVQQAFVYDSVMKLIKRYPNPKILCVGCYEDSAADLLKKKGIIIDEIDPVIDCDLDTFVKEHGEMKGKYDIIFSTSVIEHVPDDDLFVKQIEGLLAINGVCVLTCDYNNKYTAGYRKPAQDCRLYSDKDIKWRLMSNIKNCTFIDEPEWGDVEPDFEYDGCRYSFASIVFIKNKDNNNIRSDK